MATTPAKTPAKAGTKPAAARPKAAAKTAKTADAAAGEGAEGPATDKASIELRLKELLDKVVTSTGAKKAHVRVVIDATLKEMGDALAGGQALNLPGLGKVRVVRMPEAPAGAMTLKLRRILPGAGKAAGEGGAEPLAAVKEDS